MIKFLDLHAQYLSIQNEIDSAIQGVVGKSAFIGGEYLKRFEEEFATFQRVRHCVGVANGTDALEIAIEALELPAGAEIIVPANTFIACSEAVTRTGRKVVFCDCNPRDYTIDIESLKSKISRRTAAIMVVHLYGHPCDMDPILHIARDNGLKVIEDCAQAHASEYKGRRVGSIGDIGTFSFYPGKNLGAYGDAGAIVCQDEGLALRCRMIPNHGRVAKYDHVFEGRSSRLDGLQAAILSAKLKHLEGWTRRRIEIADAYLSGMAGVRQVVLPRRADWARAVYHLFVIRTKQRDSLRAYLLGKGIETGIHYPIALPKLDAYSYLGAANEPFAANRLDAELLSLPIGEHMSAGDVGHVISSVRAFFASSANSTDEDAD